MSEVPDKGAELFDVSLLVQTDLTPDNDKDNAGDVPEAVSYVRLMPVSAERKQTTLYNYFRYVFDFGEAGLSLSDILDSGELLAVYADIYYNEDINYDELAYGTLFLYDYKTDIVKERLTSKDKQAIKKYVEVAE